MQELTWGNTDQIQALETPDVILLADCIYYGEVSVMEYVFYHEENAFFLYGAKCHAVARVEKCCKPYQVKHYHVKINHSYTLFAKESRLGIM